MLYRDLVTLIDRYCSKSKSASAKIMCIYFMFIFYLLTTSEVAPENICKAEQFNLHFHYEGRSRWGIASLERDKQSNDPRQETLVVSAPELKPWNLRLQYVLIFTESYSLSGSTSDWVLLACPGRAGPGWKVVWITDACLQLWKLAHFSSLYCLLLLFSHSKSLLTSTFMHLH